MSIPTVQQLETDAKKSDISSNSGIVDEVSTALTAQHGPDGLQYAREFFSQASQDPKIKDVLDKIGPLTIVGDNGTSSTFTTRGSDTVSVLGKDGHKGWTTTGPNEHSIAMETVTDCNGQITQRTFNTGPNETVSMKRNPDQSVEFTEGYDGSSGSFKMQNGHWVFNKHTPGGDLSEQIEGPPRPEDIDWNTGTIRYSTPTFGPKIFAGLERFEKLAGPQSVNVFSPED